MPAELFELYLEDGRPGGLRPPPLAEVRPQDVVKRYTGTDIEIAPSLPFLDVSLPQVEWTQQLDCLSLQDALGHVQFSVPLVEVMAVPRPAPPGRQSFATPFFDFPVLHEFLDEPAEVSRVVGRALQDLGQVVDVPVRRHIPACVSGDVVEQVVNVPVPF